MLAEFRCGGFQEDIEIPTIGSPAQPDELDRLLQAHDAMISINKLSKFGQFHTVKILEQIEKGSTDYKEHMERLNEVDSFIVKFRDTVPILGPLVDTWRTNKELFAPSNTAPARSMAALKEVVSVTEGAYRELGQNVDMLMDLIQTAVTAAQKRQQSVLKENVNENSSC